ncbi:hypothetical protein CYY_010008, partial [Polysphondylium violaceum]
MSKESMVDNFTNSSNHNSNDIIDNNINNNNLNDKYEPIFKIIASVKQKNEIIESLSESLLERIKNLQQRISSWKFPPLYISNQSLYGEFEKPSATLDQIYQFTEKSDSQSSQLSLKDFFEKTIQEFKLERVELLSQLCEVKNQYAIEILDLRDQILKYKNDFNGLEIYSNSLYRSKTNLEIQLSNRESEIQELKQNFYENQKIVNDLSSQLDTMKLKDSQTQILVSENIELKSKLEEMEYKNDQQEKLDQAAKDLEKEESIEKDFLKNYDEYDSKLEFQSSSQK